MVVGFGLPKAMTCGGAAIVLQNRALSSRRRGGALCRIF